MSREQRVREQQLRLEELELQHRCCICESNYNTKRVSEHDWERLGRHFGKPVRGFMCDVCTNVASLGNSSGNATSTAPAASTASRPGGMGEVQTPLPMELKNAAAAVFCASCGNRRSTVVHMAAHALLCSQCGDETCKSLSSKFATHEHFTIQKAMKSKKKFVPSEHPAAIQQSVPEPQHHLEELHQQAVPPVQQEHHQEAVPPVQQQQQQQQKFFTPTPTAPAPAPAPRATNTLDDLFSAPVQNVAYASPHSGGFDAFSGFDNQPQQQQKPQQHDFFSTGSQQQQQWGNAFGGPSTTTPPPPQQQHDFFSSSAPQQQQHVPPAPAQRTAADIERDPTLTQMQKATMIQELARQNRGKSDANDIFSSLKF